MLRINSAKKQFFVGTIVEYYERRGRKFPWRETADPYKVLVAEIMLRKTTAKQVEKVYTAFIDRFPNVYKLADASKIELEKMLKPLGMEAKRSTQLIMLAESIVRDLGGRVPLEIDQLLRLPGVGRYTARAVLVLARNEKLGLLDTNVIRVLKRFFGIKSNKRRERDDDELWAFLDSLVPCERSREFNLGLIDFGSNVCTAKNPACNACPLRTYCSFANKKVLE